jgi:hypothetical protein
MKARRVRGFVISLATAAFVVAGAYLIYEADEPAGEPRGPEMSAGKAVGALPASPDGGASPRERLLHATSQELGITPARGVWGVLMERGYAKGVATVVALADGTANMYLSTGSSAVGGKAYAPARAAALKLCELAADSLDDTTPTHDFPAPAKGRVRFYVLVGGGVRVAEADVLARVADAGGASLAPWLAAGDALLDALKEATSQGWIR